VKKTERFAGWVAAVTGAASGIGRALALDLAQRGCEVALSDIDATGLAETAAMVRGAHATTRKLDVTDREAVRAWAAEVLRDHGRVNFIFNNAGISYGATVRGCEEEELERIVDVDFWGVVYGTRAFLPHLEQAGDGHVVNISSVFGLIAFPGQCAYNAAKFAVRGYTEALRMELEMTGSAVSATCVHPGGIKTNIARTSRTHPSVASLGFDPEDAKRQFEKSFRVAPEEAARVILAGVARNARRVLIGTDARVIDTVQRLLPGSYHPLVAKIAALQLRRAARS